MKIENFYGRNRLEDWKSFLDSLREFYIQFFNNQELTNHPGFVSSAIRLYFALDRKSLRSQGCPEISETIFLCSGLIDRYGKGLITENQAYEEQMRLDLFS